MFKLVVPFAGIRRHHIPERRAATPAITLHDSRSAKGYSNLRRLWGMIAARQRRGPLEFL